MEHDETPEPAPAGSGANDKSGDVGDEPVSISELLAADRGRLDASLRAASPEEIRNLLRDETIRVRVEQALRDLGAE